MDTSQSGILSSVAMATMWRRGICCSSCLCALNSGEGFFYYSWMKKRRIWYEDESLCCHIETLKNQVKSFNFERCFLDLMDFFSEDWIRKRIHLKTKMAIAEIKMPIRVPGSSFVIGGAGWGKIMSEAQDGCSSEPVQDGEDRKNMNPK